MSGTMDDAGTGQPWGIPPSGYRLPSETRVGRVRLEVADLDRSVRWYASVLGFELLEREGNEVALGAAGIPLVELQERPGATSVHRRPRLGLYHYAVLLPDRPSLGRFVLHLRDLGESVGAADHLVSEALYLWDPDGLGVEVYADRPREAWRHRDREIEMATDPLDLAAVAEAGRGAPWKGMPPGTTIGHVHLHVGDLDRAAAFYSGVLGFDRTVWNYPGALFFGADGYHHHVGTNLWAGPAAQPPAADEAQLLGWEIVLSDPASLAAARASAAGAGYTPTPEAAAADGGFGLADPWGIPVRLRAAR